MVTTEHFTIYSPYWTAARERVDALEPKRRAVYVALLDYLEKGWEIFVPLVRALPQLRREDDAVRGLVLLEIADEYRGVVFAFRRSVPLRGGFFGSCNAADQAEGNLLPVKRCLRVLEMAAAHPDFPEPLRHLAPVAAAAFNRWLKGFPKVYTPVYRIEDRVRRLVG